MRSLSIKITLAFVFVSLLGAVSAALLIQQRTQSAFNRFLHEQDKNTLISELTQHYQETGSWVDVEEVFRQLPRLGSQGSNAQFQDSDPRPVFDLNRLPFVLVDTNGYLVFGRSAGLDQPVSPQELDKSIPLEIDGQTVGWLLESPSPFPRDPNTPERRFWATVNQAILFSAIGTLLIALLLGGYLARSLTRPLRELGTATQIVAQGDLGYQVEVHSKDELGQLATSFNKMSADLAKSTQLRKQMTADVAHDLRNPLSVIMGYTEALSDGKLSGSSEVYTTMHQEVQHLSYLIDDLRTLSLADSGELPLTLQPVDPRILLDRTVKAHAPQAQQKTISLRVETELGLPMIEVDPDRMSQVLENLVSNALRHTPHRGWVVLSATSDESTVSMQVRDNGTGIAPEDLPYIFNRFYRGDKSRQLNGEAGLGLAIAKSLVQAHGGTLSVKSELEQGATFTIRIPIIRQGKKEESAP